MRKTDKLSSHSDEVFPPTSHLDALRGKCQARIDAWRKTGWVPEVRANNVLGWTQGGSNGVNILADFAVKYHNEASKLGVDINELYAGLRTDGLVNPPEWDIHGRQVNVYQYVYTLIFFTVSYKLPQTIRLYSIWGSGCSQHRSRHSRV